MNDIELCEVCGGNGTIKIPGGVSTCDTCLGTGIGGAATSAHWRQRAEQAEAETARLREAFQSVEAVIVKAHKSEEQLRIQVAALTQERDALRTERLERDDMREGV